MICQKEKRVKENDNRSSFLKDDNNKMSSATIDVVTFMEVECEMKKVGFSDIGKFFKFVFIEVKKGKKKDKAMLMHYLWIIDMQVRKRA